ncbi:MAG: transcriptional repressor [Burkholderiales bacterium]|nr:transcriptional repressor [Burkholderiales bacterium]
MPDRRSDAWNERRAVPFRVEGLPPPQSVAAKTGGCLRRPLAQAREFDGLGLRRLYFEGMRIDLESPEDLASLLRGCDINPTRQRLQIARVLFANSGHLSADQVLAAVNGRRPATSKATVYNTLNLFRDRGLIREVIANPNKIFYDANTLPHYHFYDVDTGELTDIDAQSVQVTGLPPLPAGTVTAGVDIVVRVRSKAG